MQGKKKKQVNVANIVKIYLYVCIKFLMYKVLFWQLKLVSIISIFAIKITFKKLSKMIFIMPKKTPFVLEIFKLLYFPLLLFFPFLAIADFIEVD